MALEEAVAELRQQQERPEKLPATLPEDEIIPGTEYPIVLSPPSVETIRCEAVVKWVCQSASQGLGLSDSEWASLGLEYDDE